MTSIDLLKTGMKNLKRRKARTFLTVLGVLIGTTSIVIMVSFGIGIKNSINDQMLSFGSLRLIEVNNYNYGPDMGTTGTKKKEKLNDALINKISGWDGVEAATPLMEANLKCVAGKYMSSLMVLGINPDVLEKLEFSTQEGRLLNKTDDLSLLVGSMVPMNFYNPKKMNMNQGMMGSPDGKPPVDLMKEKLVLTFDFSYGEKVPNDPLAQPEEKKKPAKIYKAKAVGIIKLSNNEKDYSVYMNLEVLKRLIKENSKGQRNSEMMGMGMGMTTNPNEYNRAQVLVKDIKDVEEVQNKIKEMGLGASSIMDMAKEMEKSANVIQLILGALGAISFFVAAIGIGNTMVMSVYERTKEIGIMKVLGATFGDIRMLFLLEAALIGFFGGMLGVGLSYGASKIINTVINSMSQGNMEMGGPGIASVIPLWLSILAVAFSSFIGVLSGLYPAIRAMKLSALEAIKTD